MHTAASLTYSTEYTPSDQEMYKLLVEMPDIRKHFIAFGSRAGIAFPILKSVSDTLIKAIDKLLEPGKQLIARLPINIQAAHELKEFKVEWFDQYSTTGQNYVELKEKYMRLKLAHLYKMPYGIEINQNIIKRWFDIMRLEEYINDLTPKLPFDPNTFNFLFTMAFIRKRTEKN